MTSTNTQNEPIGFWRDWFARLGVGVGAATVICNSIYGVLTSVGIVRWRVPTTPQELWDLEKYRMYCILIPILMSFFLILIGAYRALKRKKMF
jgi:predicted transporter